MLALEYPSIFIDDNGLQCTSAFFDVLPGSDWNEVEIDEGHNVWAPALNQAVKDGAIAAGFEFVSGISADFAKHGMCAADRFVNTAEDSADKQGNDEGDGSVLAVLSTTGTAHPNAKGYAKYAQRILDKLEPLMDNNGPHGLNDWADAGSGMDSWFSVVENDIDIDGDILSARVTVQPLHGTVTMTKGGTATYRSKLAYSGYDSFVYEVTDGEFSDTAEVTIAVAPPVLIVQPVLIGSMNEIGGMVGNFPLSPPYLVVLDEPVPVGRGRMQIVPDLDRVIFDAPLGRRRGMKLPYTVYSTVTDPDDPSFGRSVRGILKLKIVKRLRS